VTSVPNVITEGRSDVEAFFTLSGYYKEVSKWTHYPLLTFSVDGDDVHVGLVFSQSELRQSTLPDDTACMQQWGGQWRSDFFRFTLGQARAALNGGAR
jgi:hypothetical protein